MPLFGKKYSTIKVKRREFPEGLWSKCHNCNQLLYTKVLKQNLMVCPKCNYHHTLNTNERLHQLVDEGAFVELYGSLTSQDPLKFVGVKSYVDKLAEDEKRTGLKAAAMTGYARIGGYPVAITITDSRFIMGSMGSVVGEKITRIAEYALKNRLPLIIVSGSGGGARMYEGALSLMQMAKTSAAIARMHEAGLLFISVLTNPTMAGVLASFASLGDILIAEPKALIGFTGPRVIRETIKQELPAGFQRSEFLLKHGLIDMIVQRKQLRPTIISFLKMLVYQKDK